MADFQAQIQVIKQRTSSETKQNEGFHQHDICQVQQEMAKIEQHISDVRLKIFEMTRQKMGAIEMNVMNQIANKRQDAQIQKIVKGVILTLEDILVTVDNLYGGYNERIKELQRRQDVFMYNIREIEKQINSQASL